MEITHGSENELKLTTLPADTRKALEYLVDARWMKRAHWYLAGGTALALQVAHRASVDLDFFTPKVSFSAARLLARFPETVWETEILKEGTVYGKLFGAKVSFIAYPFFHPREPMLEYGAVQILTAADIAVMKIVAISQRGRKRDFLDLYWYCRNREPLEAVLRRLPDQYPTVAHNYHHILKSLTYFADAEGDPMPRLFFPATWKQIKRFFEREVPKVARKLLHLS